MSTEFSSSTLDPVDLDDLREAVYQYVNAKALADQWLERAAQERGRIEEALGDNELGLIDSCPVVRWTHVTSNRVDTAMLKAKYPDIAREVTVPSTSRRFTLVIHEDET